MSHLPDMIKCNFEEKKNNLLWEIKPIQMTLSPFKTSAEWLWGFFCKANFISQTGEQINNSLIPTKPCIWLQNGVPQQNFPPYSQDLALKVFRYFQKWKLSSKDRDWLASKGFLKENKLFLRLFQKRKSKSVLNNDKPLQWIPSSLEWLGVRQVFWLLYIEMQKKLAGGAWVLETNCVTWVHIQTHHPPAGWDRVISLPCFCNWAGLCGAPGHKRLSVSPISCF